LKFADFFAGARFALGPVTLTEQESIAFAEQYDTQWFHVDAERARHGPWAGLIGSGWLTCALAMQLVSRELLTDSESYASPGLSYLRWPNPTMPGDRLFLTVLVLESRLSQSKPWLGVVRWQWLMTNQDDKEVLDLEATSFFRLPSGDAD
jgi:acyl dehydratase